MSVINNLQIENTANVVTSFAQYIDNIIKYNNIIIILKRISKKDKNETCIYICTITVFQHTLY